MREFKLKTGDIVRVQSRTGRHNRVLVDSPSEADGEIFITVHDDDGMPISATWDDEQLIWLQDGS